MPAPFSRDCQVASDAVIRESPLPNVAAALQQRKTVRILAIGASATTGRRGRRGTYTEQIEQILEQAVKGLNVVIINRGVSGELAADAARRIKTEAGYACLAEYVSRAISLGAFGRGLRDQPPLPPGQTPPGPAPR